MDNHLRNAMAAHHAAKASAGCGYRVSQLMAAEYFHGRSGGAQSSVTQAQRDYWDLREAVKEAVFKKCLR